MFTEVLLNRGDHGQVFWHSCIGTVLVGKPGYCLDFRGVAGSAAQVHGFLHVYEMKTQGHLENELSISSHRGSQPR